MPRRNQLPAGRLFVHALGEKLRLILLSVALIIGMNLAGIEMAQGQGYRKPVPKQMAKLAKCLPANISLDQIATYGPTRNVPVWEKLKQLNARCRKGLLVGSDNKEIRFFRLSCRGFPGQDYEKLQAEEDRKLKELKRKYRVIVIGCDPRIP